MSRSGYEAMSSIATPAAIVSFWREAGPDRWYKKDAALDAEISARFRPAFDAAANGGLAAWEAGSEGALALVLLLDQFPRNMFRGSARAFATDAQALGAARRAIALGHDAAYAPPLKRFFYLPFMHSEALADQERCIALCAAAADPEGVKYGVLHRDIIARFGRFPHRNRLLGRAMLAEEQAFLDAGGFAG